MIYGIQSFSSQSYKIITDYLSKFRYNNIKQLPDAMLITEWSENDSLQVKPLWNASRTICEQQI